MAWVGELVIFLTAPPIKQAKNHKKEGARFYLSCLFLENVVLIVEFINHTDVTDPVV